MSRVKLIVNYAVAYIMWILSFLLWLLFMFLSREAIAGLLMRFYLDGSLNKMKFFQFFNQWYFYFLGLVWLILMIVVENYFRQGVIKRNLYRRISLIVGPEIILLSIANFVRSLVTVFAIQDWLISGFGFILGVAMVWWAKKNKPPTPGLLEKKAST
jgi:type IV secretory pathway TrbD component